MISPSDFAIIYKFEADPEEALATFGPITIIRIVKAVNADQSIKRLECGSNNIMEEKPYASDLLIKLKEIFPEEKYPEYWL